MSDFHARSHAPTARRGFLGRLLGGAAVFAAMGTSARVLHAAGAAGGSAPQDAPDPDWMDSLTAKHRTVMDIAAHRNGKPLAQAKNFLDAWRDAFKMPERGVNLVLGIHGEGIPIVLTDALWARYRIGEQYDVKDGATKQAAVRNVFREPHAADGSLVSPEQSVEALQRRGVRVLICNNTIAGATRKLSDAGMGSTDEVKAAIVGGLLPGVIVVPAMVVALSQLQERGVAYIKTA